MSSKCFISDDKLNIDVNELNQQLTDITGLLLASLKKKKIVLKLNNSLHGSAIPRKIRTVHEVP